MVAQALANPGRLPFLALGEWARLLRHAQRSQLLARVAVSAFGHQADGSLPQQPRQQLERVQQATVRQRQQRRLDLLDLMHLIAPIGVDIVALKGTAHWLCDIGPTNDSQFAELDIWVERSSCERLEALLLANGWTRVDWPTPGEPLQTRWSGPPGASDHSATTLNLHCQMLPALPCADAGLAQQVAARQAVPDVPGLHVPAPSDMVLCAMAELLHNGHGEHGLRDLSDIDVLLRHFGSRPGFWADLAERADALELSRLLYYGLRHSVRLFATPVPMHVRESMRAAAPSDRVLRLMDALWSRVLCTPHTRARSSMTPLCVDLLGLRARWLRAVAAWTRRM